jgi:hypothetical protein
MSKQHLTHATADSTAGQATGFELARPDQPGVPTTPRWPT